MNPALLDRFVSRDPEERRAACMAASNGIGSHDIVQALSDALGDPVKAVGRAASDALVELAGRNDDIETSIERALRGPDRHQRWRAAFTLARVSPPGPNLLPALVEGLGSPDGDVRWASAKLIVQTGRQHAEVLHLLIGLVRGGEQAVVRRMATFALREVAPDRPEAAEVLLEAVSDPDLHVRRAATNAMASLEAPSQPVGVRLLEALREDPDAATRRLAALALGELGASDPRILPAETDSALEHAHASGDPDLRRAVDRALDRLGRGRP